MQSSKQALNIYMMHLYWIWFRKIQVPCFIRPIALNTSTQRIHNSIFFTPCKYLLDKEVQSCGKKRKEKKQTHTHTHRGSMGICKVDYNFSWIIHRYNFRYFIKENVVRYYLLNSSNIHVSHPNFPINWR